VQEKAWEEAKRKNAGSAVPSRSDSSDNAEMIKQNLAKTEQSLRESEQKTRAAQQEQARAPTDIEDARETRAAWGLLIGAVGQIYQNKLNGKQASHEAQQRQLQEQQQSANRSGTIQTIQPSSSQSSRRVHNPANEAMSCISFSRRTAQAQAELQMDNNCGHTVSVLWSGGLVNIRPGGGYRSFEHNAFRFFACRYGGPNGAGLYQNEEMKSRNVVVCHD
jgi:hypothetical protein